MVNFRDGCYMTLTVNYAESVGVSTGSVSPSSIELGGKLYLNIFASANTYHTATWTLGSYSSNQNIAQGTTQTNFTIPSSWSGAITGTSATGRVTLYTYATSGAFVGSNTYSFTVKVSAVNIAPEIGSVTATHIPGSVPASWGVYLQGKSRVTITASGIETYGGSSIASIKFTGGGYSWSSSTETSYTTGFLTVAGTNTFTVTVTDTRGYTASRSVNIIVQPYEPPAIVSLTTYRCNAASPFAANETGPSILARIVTSFTSVGSNALTIHIAFKRVGNTDWSGTYLIEKDGGWVLPANIPSTDEAPYEVKLTLYDALSSTMQIFEVAGAQYTMFFAKGGRNVSIGKAGSRDQALEINSAWKIYHGDIDITSRMSGVTSIADGGTGATTATNALTNLGASPLSHYHAASAISSGILPVTRGGTGVGSLTASRALITDTAGNVAVSAITSTQLSYLSGLYGNIQNQINALSNSGYKIAYGSASVNGNSAVTIYYSGFSYVPYIAVTYSQTGANWSGDNGCIKVYYKTTTYAYIIVGGSFATSRTVDWIAIGT